MKLFSHRDRSVHLGRYPLERLTRSIGAFQVRPGPTVRPSETRIPGRWAATAAFQPYLDQCDAAQVGDVAPTAPLTDDTEELSRHLKAGLYFLDADMAGCDAVDDDAWTGERYEHRRCVLVLIAHTRQLKSSVPGDDWIDGTRQRNADLRAAELAAITASYLRNLGSQAVAHTPSASDVDIDLLALRAGLVEVRGGTLRAPFLDGGFALAAVTTDLNIATDDTLDPRSRRQMFRTTGSPLWLLGWGGMRAGWRRINGYLRPLHLGRYPMERIRRVPEPTTFIINDEVPRVPVRAGRFRRAANRDTGPKFQRDVKVFAYKTPQAQSYVRQIRAMVPMQDGPVATTATPGTDDPDHNADAVKAFAHHLGGDMTGVCKVSTYAGTRIGATAP